MKMVVLGAHGLLGRAVVAEARTRGLPVRGAARKEADVTDPGLLTAFLSEAAPHWVVNCAAYTDVDGAEADPGVREAFQVNGEGAGHAARAAGEVGARLLQVSTDYVFDGALRRPYRPHDDARPLNAYGRSKLEGEERVRESGVGHVVVRTSWLYGPGGRNFVDTIRHLAREREELRVVDDQRSRPTRAGSLARTLVDILMALEPEGGRAVGLGQGGKGAEAPILHASDGGEASWYELAREVVKVEGLECRVLPVPSHEMPRPAPRPGYSVLDLAETEALLGRRLSPWQEELRVHLAGAGEVGAIHDDESP